MTAYHKAVSEATQGTIVIEDEFGSSALIKNCHGIMKEDHENAANALIEKSLIHARAQAKANQRAQSDPVLKTAMMMNGPVSLPTGFRQ
jgi:C4-type Zn-finger protein